MKRFRRSAAALLLAVLLAGAGVFPGAEAAGAYTVTVSDGIGGTAAVTEGESVTMRVTVSGAAFNGLQGCLRYDSDLFTPVSVTGAAAADDPDTEEIELYLLSNAALEDGAEVLTAVFRAKAAGTGAYSLPEMTVGDYEDFRKGDAAPAATVPDRVRVIGEEDDHLITVTPVQGSFKGLTGGRFLPDGSIMINVLDAGWHTVASIPGGVRVTVDGVQDGQVVVVLDDNGRIVDLVEKSLVENRVAYVLLPGTARIRIIDNAKAFTDVGKAAWYSGYVDFASSHELLIGVGDEVFGPDLEMSRAMMVTVLWRLEDRPAAEKEASFADVARGSWYAEAVDWAAEKGIVLGYSDEAFGPRDNVTREQLAALLYRYMKDQGFDVSAEGDFSRFTDKDEVSAWAREAMGWAVGSGLIRGRGETLLAPKGTATRAEAAAMLMRLVTMMVKGN